MSNDTQVGDVQAPDLEKMIDEAADEVQDQPTAEVTDPTPVPASTVPTTVAKTKAGYVRLLPSMKDKALTPGQHNAGMQTFEVPSKEEQIAGFYMHNAAEFIPQFRQFGFDHTKGQPKQSVKF